MTNDWRSKPRKGKHEFMKSAIEIAARLQMGETQKTIFDDLIKNGMTLSYSQFNRYVRNLINKKTNVDVAVPKAVFISEEPNELTLSDWHSINITRQPLIDRLEENGITADEVKQWGLSNETQVSKKLTEILIKRNK